ncbi:MAG: peptidase S41 [Chloroflexi bacterium]|nr:peptidase S41 [Chloroflexota bacterium]
MMVYAIAYWTNTWGDPYLEERDLYGGGWSSAYASTRVDPNPSAKGEIIGGKYLIFAPEEGQGFPSGFGEDGRLFTADDPIVVVPQGYTVVNLESDPFTFDRSRRPVINLIEGEGSEQEDYSNLSYTEAFDALIELFRETYAYTELKEIDWDAKLDEFRPMFEQAEEDVDVVAYQLALRDFIWSIPDGHLSAPFDQNQFAIDTAGGLGIAARELDDGRVLVNFLLPDSPADEAGIELRAELLELNGQPVQEVIPTIQPWSLPFSADHTLRLQQLRYMLRSPIGTEVEVTYQNPGDDEPTTVTLTSIPERISFAFSSFNAGLTGAEQPIEFRPLDNGYGYVKIYSFSDNDLLSIQLWERMIRYLNSAGTPGLIIDMRQNGGGSGFLADQMAAYFYQEALVLGNSESYDESLGRFYADPDLEQRFFLPPTELRYDGPIAVLVGPNCNSACEYFTYNMTLEDRAAIVGQYPTAGLGGGQTTYLMPGGLQLQYSFTRSVGPEGEIIIEGTGVEPTVRVPVDEETLFSETDPILDGAVAYLDELTAIDLVDGGEIAVGETVTGEVVERQRVRYTLTFEEEGVISIFLTDETNDLDTVLRIYNAAGQLLAENDDAEVGVPAPNSSLTALEVPADLTVLVEVGTYEDAFAGSYTLEVRSAE